MLRVQIVNFIRAQVKTPDVFCYLKSSFVPSPELTIQSLFEVRGDSMASVHARLDQVTRLVVDLPSFPSSDDQSFKTGDELIITYAISPTFG